MSSTPENPLKRLIRETHRRSLWQVLGIYLVGGWIAFEVVQTLTEGLGLPDWFPALAIVLLVIGLPAVLATAFVQEGGPERGPERGSEDIHTSLENTLAGDGSFHDEAGDGTTAQSLFTWRNAILGGVGAFALWGVLAGGWILLGGEAVDGSTGANAGAPSAVEQSVAVLPFDNMSGNPDNEYFSDGITEELLNALAQIPDLRVPGRTSSFAFKGQNITIQQIADTLNVAHVLEGSVRREGDRVLITAQLVDARTDTHLWSETFERELEDVFAIQREIAAAIADELQVTLSGEEQARLALGETENTEAHEAYLRGRYLWNQRTGESLRAAIEHFERAVEIDPEYAEAWAGLADSYRLLPEYAGLSEWRPWLLRGMQASRGAVSLSPGLGMAHASLGWGLFMLGEWESASRELETAIRLSPGYATAHQWYGFLLFTTGRLAEGVLHSERALELDPISPVIAVNLGRGLKVAGRTEEAMIRFRETVNFAPGWPIGWMELALILLEVGEYEQGTEAWLTAARLLEADVSEWATAYRAAVRHRETGEPQTSPHLEENLIVRFQIPILTGDFERALRVLEELVRQGAPGYLAGAHALTSSERLRDHPRYQALLEEAGITW